MSPQTGMTTMAAMASGTVSLFAAQERLLQQLRAAGTQAIDSLGRLARHIESGGALPTSALPSVLQECGATPTEQARGFCELQRLLEKYTDELGEVDVRALLTGIRGEMGEGMVAVRDVAAAYNARCHPAVMEARASEDEARQAFLDQSFGACADVSAAEFVQYYSLVSCGMHDDTLFQLIIFKDWKVTPDNHNVDATETNVRALTTPPTPPLHTKAPLTLTTLSQIKTQVYKGRIRLREFFVDFDRLRSGYVTPGQLKSGMSAAGVKLPARDLEGIAALYTNPEDKVRRVNYRAFCAEIDSVFTAFDLEKTPLREVHMVPSELLVPDRFQRSTRQLGDDKESRLESILDRLARECRIRRIAVKPVFDDACRNQNSPMSVRHVTKQQFRQACDSKLGLLRLGLLRSEEEMELVIDKYDDRMDGMVNYVAFAHRIDPPASSSDSTARPSMATANMATAAVH
eukprot:jgi/Chlat1/2098/Chrsp17S02836